MDRYSILLTNPIFLWVLSQNGFFDDCPHRQSHSSSPSCGISFPEGVRILNVPLT